ncbi:MAG: holo-ACP synthase [Mariprofundaceae bacterium]|nr:holo-ACP synthase [Mariprofundaceae bacterium]
MSILGIGTDRVVIERVERSLNRFGDRFIRRIYTDAEHQQALGKGNSVRRLAMLFAAKEAVSKALGTGFHQGVTPKSIETIHQASGKPAINLYGAARKRADALGVTQVHVSLTDDDGVAMAFAIAEL